MKTAYILDAIEALNNAGRALRSGQASIGEQMRIGGDCLNAARVLQNAIEREHPEVQVRA